MLINTKKIINVLKNYHLLDNVLKFLNLNFMKFKIASISLTLKRSAITSIDAKSLHAKLSPQCTSPSAGGTLSDIIFME